MASKSLKALIVFLIISINVGCDQATKHIARSYLDRHTTVHVVGSVFVLQYAENDGAFLSLGSSLPAILKPALLTILPLVLMAGLLIMLLHGYVFKGNMSAGNMIAFCCIVGGGVGNLFDRLVNHGLVTDFMNFGLGSLRTGILNVADLSITFGILFMLVDSLRKSKQPPLSE